MQGGTAQITARHSQVVSYAYFVFGVVLFGTYIYSVLLFFTLAIM